MGYYSPTSVALNNNSINAYTNIHSMPQNSMDSLQQYYLQYGNPRSRHQQEQEQEPSPKEYPYSMVGSSTSSPPTSPFYPSSPHSLNSYTAMTTLNNNNNNNNSISRSSSCSSSSNNNNNNSNGIGVIVGNNNNNGKQLSPNGLMPFNSSQNGKNSEIKMNGSGSNSNSNSNGEPRCDNSKKSKGKGIFHQLQKIIKPKRKNSDGASILKIPIVMSREPMSHHVLSLKNRSNISGNSTAKSDIVENERPVLSPIVITSKYKAARSNSLPNRTHSPSYVPSMSPLSTPSPTTGNSSPFSNYSPTSSHGSSSPTTITDRKMQEITHQMLVFKPYVHKTERTNKLPQKPTDYNTGPWTDEEHEAFLRGYKEVGRQWKQIATNYVKTRDRRQVSSHAQKYFQRLHQDATSGDIVQEAP
jgi:SHAQKYF class myb-like DNA-binding protein